MGRNEQSRATEDDSKPPEIEQQKGPSSHIQLDAQRRFERQIPKLFAVLAFLLGCIYVVLLPPFQAPDEFAHFFRAYGVSQGHLVALAKTSVPKTVEELTGIFPPHFEEQGHLTFERLRKLSQTPLNESERVGVRAEAMNIYIWLPYLPAAIGIGIGRFFSLSALGLLYSARFANLVAYVTLVFTALRVLPDWRLLLCGIALLPTALLQAGSSSWDGVAFASAFLLVAYILRLIFEKNISRLATRHYVILAALAGVNAVIKVNIWLLALMLLIPAARFGGQKRRWVTLALMLLMVCALAGWWRYADRENFDFYNTARAQLGIDLASNFKIILQRPNIFFSAMGRTVEARSYVFLDNFVGTIGWLAVSLPPWVVWSFGLILVWIAFMQTQSYVLSIPQRLLLLSVVMMSAISVFAALWYAETPASYMKFLLAGEGHVPLIQGRYFIPFALPALLLLSNLRFRVQPRVMGFALFVVVVVANLAACSRIANTYYGDGQNGAATSTNSASRPPAPSHIGTFRSGFFWLLDVDGNHQFNQPPDKGFALGGIPGDIPLTGDWNGDGHTKVGIYRPVNGLFLLDFNGDGKLTDADKVYHFGNAKADDVPVVGDWNGDRRTKIGLFRAGSWTLDYNGDGVFQAGVDVTRTFGGVPQDKPVVGDWTGDGRSKLGIFRSGFYWILDYNGNGVMDSIDKSDGDKAFAFGGVPGDTPVVGDWNNDGKSKVGVFRNGSLWILDANGNYKLDGTGSGLDLIFTFGDFSKDKPVVGRW